MGLLEQGQERAVEKCGGDVSLVDWILLMLNKYCFVLADFTFHSGFIFGTLLKSCELQVNIFNFHIELDSRC